MKKIFITGSTGHVGGQIVKELRSQGNHYIKVLVLEKDSIEHIAKYVDEIYYGSVTDKNSLIEGMKDIDEVIHCAGVITIGKENVELLHAVNIGGTQNMLEAAKECGVKKFVYTSSVHALPEGEKGSVIKELKPLDSNIIVGKYAKSKAEATNLVYEANTDGFETVVCMPSGVVGPGSYVKSHIGHVIASISRSSSIINIKGGYNYVDVRDLSAGIVSALEKGRAGECYILSGEYISVKEMNETIAKSLGLPKVKRSNISMNFLKMVAPLAEFIVKIKKQKPLLTSYSLHTLTANCNFDNSKAKNELGFTTRPLSESFKDEVAFMRENKMLESFISKKKKTVKGKRVTKGKKAYSK